MCLSSKAPSSNSCSRVLPPSTSFFRLLFPLTSWFNLRLHDSSFDSSQPFRISTNQKLILYSMTEKERNVLCYPLCFRCLALYVSCAALSFRSLVLWFCFVTYRLKSNLNRTVYHGILNYAGDVFYISIVLYCRKDVRTDTTTATMKHWMEDTGRQQRHAHW